LGSQRHRVVNSVFFYDDYDHVREGVTMPQQPFKVGDRVRCVKGSAPYSIQTGKEYTVGALFRDMVVVEGLNSTFHDSRFELVFSAPAPPSLPADFAVRALEVLRESAIKPYFADGAPYDTKFCQYCNHIQPYPAVDRPVHAPGCILAGIEDINA
jgi:hypothetical protein